MKESETFRQYSELGKELPPEAQAVCNEVQAAITLLQTGDILGRGVGVNHFMGKLGDWLNAEHARLEETIHA